MLQRVKLWSLESASCVYKGNKVLAVGEESQVLRGHVGVTARY